MTAWALFFCVCSFLLGLTGGFIIAAMFSTSAYNKGWEDGRYGFGAARQEHAETDGLRETGGACVLSQAETPAA